MLDNVTRDVLVSEIEHVIEVLQKAVKTLKESNHEATVIKAFVVYNKSGRPLAYYFRTDGEEISDEEMAAIMKLHPEATDNAETWIEWCETC